MLSPPDYFTARQRRLLEQGVQLFNEGQWFEAHETWEELWHTLEPGRDKTYLQGLIQLAVVLEHARRGNPRGIVTMFDRALPRFEDVPPHHFGIDHARLREELGRLIAPVRDLPKHLFKPGQARGVGLPMDLTQAPKICPSDCDDQL